MFPVRRSNKTPGYSSSCKSCGQNDSMFPGALYGPLYYCSGEYDTIFAHKAHTGNFDSPVPCIIGYPASNWVMFQYWIGFDKLHLDCSQGLEGRTHELLDPYETRNRPHPRVNHILYTFSKNHFVFKKIHRKISKNPFVQTEFLTDSRINEIPPSREHCL